MSGGTAVIADPVARGRTLAALHRRLAASLFDQIAETGLLPGDARARARARAEWEIFALYACVRGLVAAGGFGPATAAAIEALRAESLAAGDEAGRARAAERFEEYGAIARAGGRAGEDDRVRRLGEAAARHMAGPEPPPDLAVVTGALHEALAEGAAEAVRRAE